MNWYNATNFYNQPAPPVGVLAEWSPKPIDHVVLVVVADAHIFMAGGGDDQYKAFIEDSNNARRHAVIDLGDLCDEWGPVLFPTRFVYTWNSVPYKKVLTLGNHDHLTRIITDGKTTYTSSYDALVQAMRYDTRPDIAGSKFNYALTVQSGDLKVRILTVDVNLEDGAHKVIWNGRCATDLLEWIRFELLHRPENIFVLCSHHSPHRYQIGSNFDQTDAFALRDVVASAQAARPGLRVMNFSGHSHPDVVETYDTLGSSYIGYVFPSLIWQNKYTTVDITANDMTYTEHLLE